VLAKTLTLTLLLFAWSNTFSLFHCFVTILSTLPQLTCFV
jgi:hypothetical protein